MKQQNIKLQNETFSVQRIEFEYLGFQYETFAYQFSETNCKDQSVNGSLIIPGSGNNQSYGIMKKNKENYHNGILDLLSPFNKLESTYVFIKPNEDFLAWRGPNGKKLGPNFIFQWQINNGGSYALSYHLQILAFHKWMKQCFNKTAIAGLSQGGAATLYASIVSEPDIALVASGHSLMSKFIHWSGLAQFNGFPDQAKLYEPSELVSALKTKTNWIFSWGNHEIGTYGIEAHKLITGKYINKLKNVKIVIHESSHNQGHTYNAEELRATFRTLAQKIKF